MELIKCYEVQKEFGEQKVLRNVTMEIGQHEKIGLVGANGAGKTTLANIIFGNMLQDGGTVTRFKKKLKVGYLRQSTSYTANSLTDLANEQKNFLQITSRLGLQKVNEWNEERYEGLSGGEKTKMAIAHIWSDNPDILILDEPTNHLDFQGVEWLIKELKSFQGAVLIISHDRYFLDQTVERIVELTDGESHDYIGNYTEYRKEKERRYQAQLHDYENQIKYEQKIQEEISRLNNWSSKAHREAGKTGKMADMRGTKEFYRSKAKSMDKHIKSRIKRLENLELEGVERPKEEAKIQFGWENPEKRGKRLVAASDLSKSFGERLLFQNSSFYIQRGERIGLTGPNGCGKTTFLNMLTGKETSDSGELWISPAAKIAYLTQDVTDLNPEKTVLSLIQELLEIRSEAAKARTLLANMGFHETMLKQPIKTLSLGERMRVKLALLILQQHDLLILDEPTNHMDLASREQLEEALHSFNGTLLVVSHDRFFLEKTCEKLLVFRDQTIFKTEEGFKEYMEGNRQSSRFKKETNDEKKERKMVIETRITAILGELSVLVPGQKEYMKLDEEFKELMAEKRKLQ
ncbi:macrolide transport system ATP-binding/permease protein [Fictibacillus solisalsi]|uniref:Macrolide transport system ATP-binding/permease protein n=1 Tax=Fictibacillus solisalsi TaxID=459525 RepID=A0A1G9TQ61_9BACL|nr:ABC-F type ribosomal protection protein [Fictibacillus solisalsi]SDM49833.1 macrolide transport system ATP-binding/permease protein [Fictibacillus solisalsi]